MRLVLLEQLEAPIRKGEPIGKIVVYRGDEGSRSLRWRRRKTWLRRAGGRCLSGRRESYFPWGVVLTGSRKLPCNVPCGARFSVACSTFKHGTIVRLGEVRSKRTFRKGCCRLPGTDLTH